MIADTYLDFYAKDSAIWRRWLQKNHSTAKGVWLIYFKIGSGKTRVSYGDAVEEALCFGWVDSRTQAIDEKSYKQIFTPRKKGSGWSKINKKRVEKLIQDGLMHSSGLAKIEQAKQDGSWNYLDAVEDLVMPDDFVKALAKNKKAKKNFEAFSPSSKKIILAWIHGAKQPSTRMKRISGTVKLAAQNIKANHYRQ